MSEYEGTLQEAEQPSPSKWAVEAAAETLTAMKKEGLTPGAPWIGTEPLAAIIDRAISSALAEQAKVLGEVEGALVWIERWAVGYSNSTGAQRQEARDAAQNALTKLRSLKR